MKWEDFKKMICDLHCHTKLSDGSMGIDDIIVLAEKCGVTNLAVTDLDCLAGTVRARLIGERHGIKVIQGVEISAYDSENDREVFVLGYMSDSPDRLEGLCHRNLVARKRAAQFMMIKAAQRYPITTDLVIKCAQGSTNVYPVHIMAALVECGVTTELFGELYRELFTEGGEKSLLVKPKFSEVSEVIQAIHDAGGIAILSHPGDYEGTNIVEKALEAGIPNLEKHVENMLLYGVPVVVALNIFPTDTKEELDFVFEINKGVVEKFDVGFENRGGRV